MTEETAPKPEAKDGRIAPRNPGTKSRGRVKAKGKKTKTKKPKLKLDGTPSRRGDGGGAPIGSKNREDFKTPEQKQKLYAEYLTHLRQGLDQRTFVPCQWETVERYAKEYPEIFDETEISKAKREGLLIYEKLMVSACLGTIGTQKFKGNPACLIFTVKNKLGWRDKVEVSSEPLNPFQVQIVDDIR